VGLTEEMPFQDLAKPAPRLPGLGRRFVIAPRHLYTCQCVRSIRSAGTLIFWIFSLHIGNII